MSVLEFIAALVDAVAWPLALAVVIVAFRKPLTALVRQLASAPPRSFTAGPLGWQFPEGPATEIEAAVREEVTAQPPANRITAAQIQLTVSVRVMAMHELRRIYARAVGESATRRRTDARLIAEALAAGIITHAEERALANLLQFAERRPSGDEVVEAVNGGLDAYLRFQEVNRQALSELVGESARRLKEAGDRARAVLNDET